MAKFLTGHELETAFTNIIWDAKETLLMVSPFIKPGEYFIKLFDKHLNNPQLHIIVVFGKNKDNVTKSMNKEDFEYFKQFLNVSIIYVPNLHAKYYANESKGLITSINPFDYSFLNNIEFGVYFERNILIDSLKLNPDNDAWEAGLKVANENEAVFIRRPVFERKMISILGKNYVKSDILHDYTKKYYSYTRDKDQTEIKKLADFPTELELGSLPIEKPTREEVTGKSESNQKQVKPSNSGKSGYCIRTGKPIPYNPSRPYCDIAYKSWVFYSNPDFPEQYCHKTGKPSNGKTSMNKPILFYH